MLRRLSIFSTIGPLSLLAVGAASLAVACATGTGDSGGQRGGLSSGGSSAAASGGAATGGASATGGSSVGGSGGSGVGGSGGSSASGSGGSGTGGYTTGGSSGTGVGGSGTGGTATGGTGTGGTATGTGGTATGGTSGSGTGGSSGTATVTILPANLIDNMENNTGSILSLGGRVGAWYTYNDQTTTGTQSPAMGSSFLPEAGGINGGHAAHTSGSGFTTWGAGMGFDLNNTGTTKGIYDASAFQGIAFWAKGTPFRVKVLIASTTPVAEGGTCQTNCGDDFGIAIAATSSFQQFPVKFSSLTQEHWGAPATFDATQMIGVQFQVPSGTTFDFWVDDIGFY